jgi:hypothetical protein
MVQHERALIVKDAHRFRSYLSFQMLTMTVFTLLRLNSHLSHIHNHIRIHIRRKPKTQ